LATQNALRLLELAGRSDIPVAHGTARPLVIPPGLPADFVHGADGLGNINLPPPAGRPIDRPAAQFIVDTVMAYPGQITLVAIGPLTNLALALRLEPRLPQNVAEVVIMGGAVSVNGNVTPAAEANIINDPHAADIALTASWPLTLVGLDVTLQTVMDDAYIESLRATGGPAAEFIYRISRFYRDFHIETYNLAGMHTHDPSAIAYLLDPTLFTTVSGPMRVVTEGLAMGQTLLDGHQSWREPNAWSGQPPVNVCLGVDSARLLALYHQRIGKRH
jgi:inosine-uridine nucleoside N-ribohydrolase